ncbi:MAG: hypothetical protein IT368_10315 [Candidatus Hydrogenedentes bacterium]|nr:hypothetical protein [Candidatus Hydrogenedentota bacterium]
MTPHQQPDRLEIINGPEDGSSFPLTRTPADVGSDFACAVAPRMDGSIARFQARLTSVSDGYRVRRRGEGKVFVNGRRAGLVRSRLLRHGGVLQVGETFLCLQCGPNGLASRGHGLVADSDLIFVLRQAWRKGGLLVRLPWRILRATLRRLGWLFILGMGTGMLIWYLRPGWLYTAWLWLHWAWWRVTAWF